MMDEQFGKLFMAGPEPSKITVAAPHAAISAVFAAVIRDFDDRPDKNRVSKSLSCYRSSPLMKCDLLDPSGTQSLQRGQTRFVHPLQTKYELTQAQGESDACDA